MKTLCGSMEFCGSIEPHYPHVIDRYRDERYGSLVRFCPGLPGDGVQFRVVEWSPGNRAFPSIFRWSNESEQNTGRNKKEEEAKRFFDEFWSRQKAYHQRVADVRRAVEQMWHDLDENT